MNIKKNVNLGTLTLALAFSSCASLQKKIQEKRDCESPLAQSMITWAPKEKALRNKYAQAIRSFQMDDLKEDEQELLRERYDARTGKYKLNPVERYILRQYGCESKEATTQEIIFLHRLAEISVFGNALKSKR